MLQLLLPAGTLIVFLLNLVSMIRDREKADGKMFRLMLAMYSACLLFAIVEYLYLRRCNVSEQLVPFLLLVLFDAGITGLMGNSVLKIIRDPEQLTKFMALPAYQIALTVGIIAMFVIWE